MNHADVAIIGLGAMGSASAYHLARAGQKVVGFDRFHPPHTMGSSHGLTRIIREAYFEDPAYVPLVQRAYQLWTDLEHEAGEQMFLRTGGLMIGRPDGALVAGALRSAREHHLQHELLDASQIQNRFPMLRPEDGMVAVHEPGADILFPERAIAAHLRLAQTRGAELHFDEQVLRWEPDKEGVRVFTRSGTYTAQRLLISAGPWLSDLLPGLRLPLQIERQVQFWFVPRNGLRTEDLFAPSRCLIYICEYQPGHYFYGFPDLGDGIKVAAHHQGLQTSPDQLDRNVAVEEIAAMRSLLEEYVPDAAGELRSSAVCMYTNTPDEHFLLDFHPQLPQVLLASPCSGHGFKFSAVIGELIGRLLLRQPLSLDINLFRMDRLLARR